MLPEVRIDFFCCVYSSFGAFGLIQKHRKIKHREKQRVTAIGAFLRKTKKIEKNPSANPFSPSDRYPKVTI